MPNTPVQLNERNLKEQLKKNLQAILVDCEQYDLKVGIPGEIRNTKKSIVVSKHVGGVTIKKKKVVKNKGAEPANVAEYAAKNEFGVVGTGKKAWNTPPRPFMRTTFQGESMQMIQKMAWKIFSEIAMTNRNAKEGLEKLGLYIAGRVKMNILRGHFKANAPETIERKGSDTPLIDTGTMRRSLTAWVTGKNK